MNRNTTTIITAVGITLFLAATLIAALLMRPDPRQTAVPTEAPSSSAAPTQPAHEHSETDPMSSEDTLRAFATAYADPSPSDSEWLASLAPYTSSALQASLATSDRTLAQQAGTDILETTDARAAIGSGGTTSYTVTLVQAPLDDHGDVTTPIIDRIDFLSPPPDAVLPLSSTAEQELTPTLMPAIAVVVAQAGGLTDVDREAHIRDVFTAPESALQIPRVAGDDTAIRIGNIHDLTLAAEDGQLVAYAVVPYAPDGSQDTQWVTVTIILERGADGGWMTRDARI